MKYVGDLIEEVRRDTRNEDVPTDVSDVGISTNDFLRYVNFAQEKCQATAISAKSTKFRENKEISLASGTILYTVPDRVYLDEHILNVKFSRTGLAQDYYPLTEVGLNKRSDYPGTPSCYIRQGSSILLCPVYNSSGAKVRVYYDRTVDTLDIRRATVALSVISGGTLLTDLQLDIATDDADALSSAQYLCINDAFGNVLMYNIPVDNYDPVTGIVSIGTATTTFPIQPGETAPIGAYVTIGKYTTTHGKLNDLCERYMAQYTEYKIFRRDSSSDANEAKNDMKETLKEISISYAETPRDDTDIAISNSNLIVGGW
jgi:hypothetical protein